MSDKHKSFEGISSILELELEAARASFAVINGQISVVERQLADLIEAVQDSNKHAGAAFAATGADLVWRRWIEGRREILLLTLANLKAQRESLRDALRRANGKAKSFEAVVLAEQEKTAQMRARKEQSKLDMAVITSSFQR